MSRKKSGTKVQSPPAAPPLPRLPLAAIAVVMIAVSAWIAVREGVFSFGAIPTRRPDNLLLITIDTLRADHLGCCGYSLPTSPAIDALAASGVLFEQARSTAPLTLPSHSTILTGLYPYSHGVRNNGDFYLPEDVPTLASVCRQRGMSTAAFVSSFVLDSRYGLDHEFGVYEDRMERKDVALQDFEVERKGGETTRLALEWLSRNRAKPFFLWLHLYDPHESYDPPEPYRSRFASAYDGEIAFADSLVGDAVRRLDEWGLREKTLLVLAADHGESLGEHQEESHSIFVYNATMHVPVVLNMPKGIPEGRRVGTAVSIADIFTTIVEIMGIPPAPRQDGFSLVPLIKRPSAGRGAPLYLESQFPKLYLGWAPLAAIQDGPWKYIEAPHPELYREDTDPGETANLYASNRAIADELKVKLESMVPRGAEDRYNRQALDDETIAKLAGLGYVGAAAYAGTTERRATADPKDKIAFFNVLREAQKQIRARQFKSAIPLLEQVVRDEPDNAVAMLFLANGYLGMEDYARAIVTYHNYLELMPASAYAHHWIAIASVRMGDARTALAEEDAALAIDPRFVDSYVMKAGILASQGRYEDAVAALEKAVAIDPDNQGLLNDMGAINLEWGRIDEAEKIYRRILDIDTEYPPAHTTLGIIRAARGDYEGAVTSFRRALTLSPTLGEARINLARALVKTGRVDEARQELAVLLKQTEGARNPRIVAMRQAAEDALSALARP